MAADRVVTPVTTATRRRGALAALALGVAVGAGLAGATECGRVVVAGRLSAVAEFDPRAPERDLAGAGLVDDLVAADRRAGGQHARAERFAGGTATDTVTQATVTPTPSPTIVGDIGWRKVLGTVYEGVVQPGREVAGALVKCSQATYFPRAGSCAPYEVTTAADGAFAFDVFVHDTDTFTISASKTGLGSDERRFTGFDCAGSCPELAMVLGPESTAPVTETAGTPATTAPKISETPGTPSTTAPEVTPTATPPPVAPLFLPSATCRRGP